MEVKARRRRRDRSDAEAERLVAAYEASGLKRQEFCERNDVTLTTLSRYVTRHRRQRAEEKEPGKPVPQFVAVEVVEPARQNAGGLVVVLGSGRRIEVKRDFDANTLQMLVRALEHC